MYRAFVCAVLGLVMLSAATANSGEAVLSVESRLGGDSNVFRQDSGEVDDGFHELAAKLEVRERREELNYNFKYAPVYETFFETDGIDGWNHLATGEVQWRSTPIDTFEVTGRFSESRRFRLDTEADVGTTTPVFDEPNRERIRRSSAVASYSRQFTPIIGGQVSFIFDDIDFNEPQNIDTRSFAGMISANYAFSQKTMFGLFGSARFRESRGVGLQPSSEATIGTIAASISHVFAEGFELRVQAGPTFIETREDDLDGLVISEFDFVDFGNGTGIARAIDDVATPTLCLVQGVADNLFQACPFVAFVGTPPANSLVALPPPANGQGESETDTSFFAEVRLIKRWRQARFSMGYTRVESANSGGAAASSIVDTVEALLNYRPNFLWNFTLRGEWSERSTLADTRRTVVIATPGPPLATSPPSNPPLAFASASSLTVIENPGGANRDRTQWRGDFQASRKLTENLRILGRVTYSKSIRSSNNSALESWLGYVGLRYEFDPVRY